MYQVICFVAREPGYRCLEALARSGRFRPRAVFSHRRKPASEDPERTEREDFRRFEDLCRERAVPMHVKDTFREAADLCELDQYEPFDFIVSCSWRFRIPLDALRKARLGTVNLHRGKLPDYRGAEPVKRALIDGRDRIVLSAHVMEEEYDTGRLLAEASIRAERRPGETIDRATDRLKAGLLPFYAQTMFEALDVLVCEHGGVREYGGER